MPEYPEPEPEIPFPYSSGKYDRDGYLMLNDAMEKSGTDFDLNQIKANKIRGSYAQCGPMLEYYGMFEPWNLPSGRTRE